MCVMTVCGCACALCVRCVCVCVVLRAGARVEAVDQNDGGWAFRSDEPHHHVPGREAPSGRAYRDGQGEPDQCHREPACQQEEVHQEEEGKFSLCAVLLFFVACCFPLASPPPLTFLFVAYPPPPTPGVICRFWLFSLAPFRLFPLQAHSDVFGGDFDGDGIDSVGMDYESKYDDFM